MKITIKDLEAVCNRINVMTKSPLTPYAKDDNGKLVGLVGNYHLSGAYGGFSLHQMGNENGGIRDVFGCGHTSKKDLYFRMHAFISGLESKA